MAVALPAGEPELSNEDMLQGQGGEEDKDGPSRPAAARDGIGGSDEVYIPMNWRRSIIQC